MASEMEEKSKKISFNPAILGLKADDGQPHLLGSRCSACGKVFFPQQALCTECFREGTLSEYPLSNRGKLYSFTVVERVPSPKRISGSLCLWICKPAAKGPGPIENSGLDA